MLTGKIALVTGASRGIGRGIALQLGEAGATVYITGRQPNKSNNPDGNLPTLEKTAQEITSRGGKGIAVYCDHSDSNDVRKLFDRIKTDTDGQLDILVNNAYSAASVLWDTMGKSFWEYEPEFWDDVNNVGLRNHYICSVYAARMMVPRKQGLIVIVSSCGGLFKNMFNTCYGVGKAACDRLAADMAHELKKHNVTAVSLWPGSVRTEYFTRAIEDATSSTNMIIKQMFDEGETPEYSGKSVIHLATDPNVMAKTGKILMTSDLGDEYGFTDIDGRKPLNIRSTEFFLRLCKVDKVPGWMMAQLYNQL